jgi:hypothetical protein
MAPDGTARPPNGTTLTAEWSFPALRAELATYYATPAVRARILEFLGSSVSGGLAAQFVTTSPAALHRPFRPSPASTLWSAIERDLELARSLLGSDGLLAHIDLEHVHFDRPWETFTQPARAFALQEPVVAAVEAALGRAGIPSLHAVTGRGHHWSWRIAPASAAFATLGSLGAGLDPRATARNASPSTAAADQAEMVHRGLGMVLEAVAHRLVRASEGVARVPVQVTAVIVGPGTGGREIVSIDLSSFGDPMRVRTARVPFTAYLKGWRLGQQMRPAMPLPPLVAVTVPAGSSLPTVLESRRPERAAAIATDATAVVPDGSLGSMKLVETYLTSPVAAYHRWYYGCEPEPREAWPTTYDRLDLSTVPPCVGQILAQPNDRILRPAELQHLVRVLMALGWHPRHIAGLVRSKLERDHGWQPGLHFFDASRRAEFYVRLFAGLIAVGTDALIDFNCVSAREKGLCTGGGYGWNLAKLRDALRTEEARWATGR